MTRQEFYDLETLLTKLSLHIGRGTLAITTGHIQDGFHIATFDDTTGEKEHDGAWNSVEGAADIIKRKISQVESKTK